ncbi:MAG: GTPase HflX [Lachnospiraceae bacterium]|nr:GTPase HflX [Lachnospiraceae bacterium]
MDLQSTSQERKAAKAVLCGLNLKDTPEHYAVTMKELGELAKALGLSVAGEVVQNASTVTQKTYIGSGKVEELRMEIDADDADIVIFNESLSPMQVRNLEDILDTEVMDRTGLILQIFQTRARTRGAKLQVESARLKYLLPRLQGMRRNLSRQGGGSGRLSNKGSGEEQIELDRRHIEHRIAEVDRQLAQIAKEMDTQRARRLTSGLPRVSLVGYTNAGKSTMMNTLLKLYGEENLQDEKQVYEEDLLFATLDTSIRRIAPDGHRSFLLSDTVGFIRDLPHSLVTAFRSTLEEIRYADLLLMIIDASDPEAEQQVKVTHSTLKEIGADTIPVLYVYNKADRTGISYPKVSGDRIYMCAKSGEGVEELLGAVDNALGADSISCEYLLPFSAGGLAADLRQRLGIDEPEYLPEGMLIRGVFGPADRAKLDLAAISGGPVG